MKCHVDFTRDMRFENGHTLNIEGDVIEVIPGGIRTEMILSGNWMPLRVPFLSSHEIRSDGMRPYRIVVMLWYHNEYVVTRFYTDLQGGFGSGNYIRFGELAGRTQAHALQVALHRFNERLQAT